ncbi:SGNH/GDSL hydrolase family protein [Caldalkalibacillus salinus]|uniref:SGNH/GDSL hydrolase family protein n=1 Tax=Caldalkalibacillus salinus TaxID=2803787 RepID=UPI0019227691|nr:SGNH/GDSL hydrolase family protein [Caldalkalibacillus salinus]
MNGHKKHILFIGDSITDSSRREDPERIGFGYVRLIRDVLMVTQGYTKEQFTNRGIGGNRVTDLESRWKKDVLDLQPDVLSISIGINDVWRQLDSPEIEQVYPEQFETVYTTLLSSVRQETDATLMLMEPTIIEEDSASKGNERLKEYVTIVNRLANRFEGTLVPTHQAFLGMLNQYPQTTLTTDGVHMNSTGDMLMAQTWLKSYSAM